MAKLDEKPDNGTDGNTGTSGRGAIQGMNVFMTQSARIRQWAISIPIVVVLAVLTAFSVMQGDPHNSIHYLLGGTGLYFLYRLSKQLWHYFQRAPELRIDANGIHLFYPNAMSWPWAAVKGAYDEDGAVIVGLRSSGGYNQGAWGRTEINIPTKSLDQPGLEITRAIRECVVQYSTDK